MELWGFGGVWVEFLGFSGCGLWGFGFSGFGVAGFGVSGSGDLAVGLGYEEWAADSAHVVASLFIASEPPDLHSLHGESSGRGLLENVTILLGISTRAWFRAKEPLNRHARKLHKNPKLEFPETPKPLNQGI